MWAREKNVNTVGSSIDCDEHSKSMQSFSMARGQEESTHPQATVICTRFAAEDGAVRDDTSRIFTSTSLSKTRPFSQRRLPRAPATVRRTGAVRCTRSGPPTHAARRSTAAARSQAALAWRGERQPAVGLANGRQSAPRRCVRELPSRRAPHCAASHALRVGGALLSRSQARPRGNVTETERDMGERSETGRAHHRS